MIRVTLLDEDSKDIIFMVDEKGVVLSEENSPFQTLIGAELVLPLRTGRKLTILGRYENFEIQSRILKVEGCPIEDYIPLPFGILAIAKYKLNISIDSLGDNPTQVKVSIFSHYYKKGVVIDVSITDKEMPFWENHFKYAYERLMRSLGLFNNPSMS